MDKMPEGETLYESSGSQPSPTSTPQGSSGKPQGASLIKLVRRVPRWWWLGSAIAVLLTASVCWYIRLQSWEVRHIPSGVDAAFLSLQWWSEPVVSGAESALPEISGRLYGVAVQNKVTGRRGRVWVVGTGGFLAYSDDEGQCWTPYEYNSGAG